MDSTTQPNNAPRRFRSAEIVVGTIVVITVLAQAILAGQHLANGADIYLHGMLGSAVFIAQIVLIILVFMDKASTETKVTTIVMLVAMFAQIGLGYAARSGGHTINAIHIPFGVALFGLAAWQLALVRQK
jgi:nitrate reductase gamma subunit